jgi:uncharacterized membrane-anchored protein
MHHNQMSLGIGARIKEYVKRRQQEGALIQCEPETILFSVCGAAQFYAMQKYMYQLSEDRFSDEQMINNFVRILMHGVGGGQ